MATAFRIGYVSAVPSIVPAPIAWSGFCPICLQQTRFVATGPYLRDSLHCASCPGGSLPRERALMLTIRQMVPDWASQRIHESSPVASPTWRGASLVLRRECPGYVPTQFYPHIARGGFHDGFRNEDLERQTFGDETFDVVVTQDVMEHVFQPELVYREVWRTLAPGGLYIHTTPVFKDLVVSKRWAARRADGTIDYLKKPEYHGNPIAESGSLVTFHYGYDLPDLIADWAPFDVEIRRFNNRTHGLVADFLDVIICRKR